MKRLILAPIFISMALLLSSCSMHLGLSGLLGNGGSGTPGAKTVKATHTPPTNVTAPRRCACARAIAWTSTSCAR